MLTVPIRLDKPVRAGEAVQVTLAAELVPGSRGGQLAADNQSGLLVDPEQCERLGLPG